VKTGAGDNGSPGFYHRLWSEPSECRTEILAGLVVMALAAGIHAAQAPAPVPPTDRRNFLACPVIRDTSTVPCWLAEYDGDLYYLGSQGSTSSAFYPPQLLHEVLVEATIADGPRICGGIPLTNVEVSVRPEINRACNTILPAEPAWTAPPSPAAPIPSFPDTTREFRILYDFDSDYLTLHTTRVIHEIVRISKAVSPVRIEISGARGAVLLSNGQTIVERDDLGRVRGEKLAVILRGLGIQASHVHVTWRDDVDRPEGVSDRQRRVVVVRLVTD
jgi:hypothetical protein